MAFLENPFAILSDTDGDDAEPFVPIAVVRDEKNPVNKKNNNQQKQQQSSVARDQPRMTRVPPHLGRPENGRGGMDRGSANGDGFHRLDNRQNGAPQSNGGKDNGQHDVNKQYGRNRYGFRQNKEGNGYHRVNRQSDTHEQNNAGAYRHYIRRGGHDSAGYEVSANKQQDLHDRGGNRREYHKINGSRNEDQILEANELVKSQGQEKLAEGDSFEGDVPELRNGEGGWNFVRDRRRGGGRGGKRGNRSWRNQFSSNSGFGGTNRGRGEASIHTPNESLNGEHRDSDDKSVAIEGEETTEISNNAEPRQRNYERNTTRNQSEPMKEDKKVQARNMTLVEYEKQLIEKRKALEALKPQERKVTLHKDFDLMQLVGRNKEDFATKLNPEEEESHEKVQLKKEERAEPRETVRKSLSADVFLKVFKRSDRIGEGRVSYKRDFKREDGGHGSEDDKEHGRPSQGFSRNTVEAAPTDAGKTIIPFNILQDSEHFPVLSAVARTR